MRESQERLERWLLLPESQEQAGERELELPRRILLQDTQKLIAPCFAPKAQPKGTLADAKNFLLRLGVSSGANALTKKQSIL